MPDGTVYGWRNRTAVFHRRFDLGFHPKDQTAKTSRGDAGTVAFPTAAARFSSPSDVVGTDPPWSLCDFFHTAEFVQIGAALGNFQALVAATTNVFDIVYLGRETLNGEDSTVLTVPNYDELRNWRGVHLRRTAFGTRA
jgi:hypothetical protein